MKILVVNSYYYPNCNGGAEMVARTLSEELVKRGHRVDVLTVDDHFHRDVINGVNVTYLDTFIGKYRKKPDKRLLFTVCRGLRLFAFLDWFRLRRMVNKKYDVVHTHAIEDFSPIIWLAASSCKIPVVHTMHDKYMICPRLFKMRADGSLCKKPHILCRIRQLIYTRLSKCVNVFISPSKALAKTQPVRSVVIHNGIELSSDITQRTYPADRPFRFLFAGSVAKHKGIPVLLEAFAKFKGNAELHIAGDGELRSMVEIAAQKDSRIHYYGWVDKTKVDELMKKCDCLILPSVWEENCPVSILEAYSKGIPDICSNIGGIPELIADGKTGYLITPGDPDDLYRKMCDITNENVYNKMCANISAVKEKFSLDRQVEKYEKACFSLVMAVY